MLGVKSCGPSKLTYEHHALPCLALICTTPSLLVPGNPTDISQSASAAYPNPKFDNPNGWRFKVKANSSVTVATKSAINLVNSARADSKLGPAIAKAGTNVLSTDAIFGVTDVNAYARPGLQYGATVAEGDQYLASTKQDVTGNNFNAYGGYVADAFMGGVVRARATAGQGQTVAAARNVMISNVGGIASDVRTDANSARWYMSPGHAIAGAANIARSGRIYMYTKGRARAELGTATSGILNWGVSNGVTPWASKQIPNNIYSELDHKVNNDAGNAAAGYLNIQKSYGGKVAIRNFPAGTAATAVGNAVAGGVTVAYSEGGKAQVGDYDQENDSPENDVAATTRGRGEFGWQDSCRDCAVPVASCAITVCMLDVYSVFSLLWMNMRTGSSTIIIIQHMLFAAAGPATRM